MQHTCLAAPRQLQCEYGADAAPTFPTVKLQQLAQSGPGLASSARKCNSSAMVPLAGVAAHGRCPLCHWLNTASAYSGGETSDDYDAMQLHNPLSLQGWWPESLHQLCAYVLRFHHGGHVLMFAKVILGMWGLRDRLMCRLIVLLCDRCCRILTQGGPQGHRVPPAPLCFLQHPGRNKARPSKQHVSAAG